MATLTATLQYATTPKAVHTGVLHTGARAQTGSTLTASSVILLCDLPDGATVLDWWAFIDGAGANQVVQIGTSNTPSGIASAFSLSGVTAGAVGAGGFRAPFGDLLPVRISLSDDVEPAQVNVQAKLGAAISASIVLNFNLFYTMDGTPGANTIR